MSKIDEKALEVAHQKDLQAAHGGQRLSNRAFIEAYEAAKEAQQPTVCVQCGVTVSKDGSCKCVVGIPTTQQPVEETQFKRAHRAYAKWYDNLKFDLADAEIGIARNAYIAGYVTGNDNIERESGWQPIETAPKDIGNPILIFSKNEGVCRAFWGGRDWQIDASDYDVARDNDGAGLYISSPTHWMPLPTPPIKQIEGDN